MQQVGEKLGLPQSSADMHISVLEDARIIRSERHIVNGHPFKICHVEKYLIHIILRVPIPEIDSIASVHVPIVS